MPRDSGGNYTLAAGNPVASGTVISTTWANPTMDDLAVAMTESLSRAGNGGMLVPFQNIDGTVISPGVTFTNEPGSGLWRAGSNDVRMAVGSEDSTRWISAIAQPVGEQNPFQIWNGSSWANVLYAGGSGLPLLPNDTYLQARNAANDGNIDLIKANASDEVELGNGTTIAIGGDIKFRSADGADQGNLIKFIHSDFQAFGLGSIRVEREASGLASSLYLATSPNFSTTQPVDGLILDGTGKLVLPVPTGGMVVGSDTGFDFVDIFGGTTVRGSLQVAGDHQITLAATDGLFHGISVANGTVDMGIFTNSSTSEIRAGGPLNILMGPGGTLTGMTIDLDGDVHIPNGSLQYKEAILEASDANNATEGGDYWISSGAANLPAAGNWHVHAFPSDGGNPNFYGQMAFSSTSGTGSLLYWRVTNNGGSGGWKQVLTGTQSATETTLEGKLLVEGANSEFVGPLYISDAIGNTRFSIDFAGGVFMNNTDNSTVNFQTSGITALSYNNTADVQIPNGHLSQTNVDPTFSQQVTVDGQTAFFRALNSVGNPRAGMVASGTGTSWTLNLRSGAYVNTLECDGDNNVFIKGGNFQVNAGGDATVAAGAVKFTSGSAFPGAIGADGGGYVFTKALEGLTLVGRGSAYDFQLTNQSGSTAMKLVAATVNLEMEGTLTMNGGIIQMADSETTGRINFGTFGNTIYRRDADGAMVIEAGQGAITLVAATDHTFAGTGVVAHNFDATSLSFASAVVRSIATRAASAAFVAFDCYAANGATFLFEINGGGVIKAQNLSGTGSRPVFAAADGTLSAP